MKKEKEKEKEEEEETEGILRERLCAPKAISLLDDKRQIHT